MTTTYKQSITEKVEKPKNTRRTKKTVEEPKDIVVNGTTLVKVVTDEDFRTPHEIETMKKNGTETVPEVPEVPEGSEEKPVEMTPEDIIRKKFEEKMRKEKERMEKEIEKEKKRAERQAKGIGTGTSGMTKENFLKTIFGWNSEGKVEIIGYGKGERNTAKIVEAFKDDYSNITTVGGFKYMSQIEKIILDAVVKVNRKEKEEQEKKGEGEKSPETPSNPAPETPKEEEKSQLESLAEVILPKKEDPKSESEEVLPETVNTICSECGTFMDLHEEGLYCPLCDIIRN